MHVDLGCRPFWTCPRALCSTQEARSSARGASPAPASPKDHSCHLCAGQAPHRVGRALGRQRLGAAATGSGLALPTRPPCGADSGIWDGTQTCRTFGRFEFPCVSVTHRPQTLLRLTISWVRKAGSAGGSVPCGVDGGRWLGASVVSPGPWGAPPPLRAVSGSLPVPTAWWSLSRGISGHRQVDRSGQASGGSRQRPAAPLPSRPVIGSALADL